MIPKRILPAILIGLMQFGHSSAIAQEQAKAKRPNIVVILADDFGVGDIQAHYPQNKIPTPNLDRLVRQGLSFRDAHSPSAVCTPTRYGLLTGRYCWRTRLQEWVLGCYEPPLIDARLLTLPGFLQKHGYRTACIGKWHLGWEWQGAQPSRMTEPRNALGKGEWDFTKPIGGGPRERGFDHYFGVDLPNFPPFTFIENDCVVALPTARYQPDGKQGVFMPTGFAGAPIAPDWRFDRIVPTLAERAVKHVHEQAKRDAPFFLYVPLTSPHEPVSPSEKFAGKSGIAPIADFVMETDWAAGQVLQAVEDAGIADDTIVIFTADNGHSHYTGWEKLVAAGHQPSGPYRGHKGDIWEGGHRVPFVVRWPGRVKENSSSDQLLCLTDVFATLAELVGENLPVDAAEDSFSFLQAALEKSETTARASVVSHSVDGEFAFREGPWKIVFTNSSRNLNESRGKPTVVGLYNLADDLAETTDVARQRPDVVEQLTRQLQTIVTNGRSRPGPPQANDTEVRFDATQAARWTPAK